MLDAMFLAYGEGIEYAGRQLAYITVAHKS
jgi:hypothetical protein